ncbi:MAG: hypothetical protein V1875_04765 [Candidatus Altiarchaeota archaeon]
MDSRLLAVAMLVFAAGCVELQGGSGNDSGNIQANATSGYVGSPKLLFRLYDNNLGDYASGALLCQNWSGARIEPSGTMIVKADIVVGECAVGLPHDGYVLYLPLTIDPEFLSLLNSTDEYALRYDSRNFEYRYFIFVDQESVPLQGLLYLEGRLIGQTDRQGVIAVNLTHLHPGNITFSWIVGDMSPAEWELQYLASDMKSLFIRVPADTRGLNVTAEP